MGNFQDLTGQRFGRLTVLRLADRTKPGYYRYECLCDCGKTTIVQGNALRSGTIKSCGCLRLERLRESLRRRIVLSGPGSPKFADLTGQTFGRLTVLGYAGKKGGSTYNCLCTCGNTKIVLGRSLTTGATKSCGCLLMQFAQVPSRSCSQKLCAGCLQTKRPYAKHPLGTYGRTGLRPIRTTLLLLRSSEVLTLLDWAYKGENPAGELPSNITA